VSTTVTSSAPTVAQTTPGPIGYLPALDGLRGLSVAAVLVFHAGYYRGGFLGVDLFFVLSGFLITSLLIKEMSATSTVAVMRFWGRRFRRLLPAVLVSLVGVTLLVFAFGSVAEQAAALDDGPWAQFYLANWHALSKPGGYWASFELPRVFGHLWSLGIEQQFYVIWPVAVLGIARLGRHRERWLAVACAVLALASLVQSLRLFDPANPTRVYMGTDTRASSLLLGALCATSFVRAGAGAVQRRLGRWVDVPLIALLVGFAVAWALIDGTSSPWLFQGGMFVHSMFAAVLVVLSAETTGTWTNRFLGHGTLRWLGTISYSLYLWHWPIFVLLSPERTHLDGWPLVVLRITVSIAAAWLSKLLVEDPIRFRAGWMRGRVGIATFVASMAAVGAFWVLVPSPDTAPAAFDPSTVTVAPTATTSPTSAPTSAPTSTPDTTPDSTPAPSTTATPTTVPAPLPPISRVLLLGDSVLFDSSPGVVAALESSGMAVLNNSFPGAGVLSDQIDVGPLYAESLATFQPDLVIYQFSLWDQGTPDEQFAAYEAFAAQVNAAGAQLLFLTEPPIRTDLSGGAMAQLPDVAARVVAEDPTRRALVDSSAVWGTKFLIDIDGDSVPERKPDGVHVCPSGSARLAAWLLSELASRYRGLTPIDPATWAAGPWITDKRYTTPAGICATVN
jgi:peptidoglycan/LPS O-acetylase OafA/YrhL